MNSLKIETLARAASWICVAIILYLSLVPGGMRPHTSASGHAEHFIAYAGTGLLFAIGAGLRQRFVAALGLAALSGVAEIAQLGIPGRTSEFSGFFYSTLGAWGGLLAGAAGEGLLARRRGESRLT